MKRLGKPGVVMPEIGAGVAVPRLVQLRPAAPDDLHGPQEPAGVEAGAEDDHVGRDALCRPAVSMPSAVIFSIGSVTRSTLSRFSAAIHTPLSQQGALAADRIGRDDFLEQVRRVGRLGADRLGQHLAQHRRWPRPTALGRPVPVAVGLHRLDRRRRSASRTARTGTTCHRRARARAATFCPRGTSSW